MSSREARPAVIDRAALTPTQENDMPNASLTTIGILNIGLLNDTAVYRLLLKGQYVTLGAAPGRLY